MATAEIAATPSAAAISSRRLRAEGPFGSTSLRCCSLGTAAKLDRHQGSWWTSVQRYAGNKEGLAMADDLIIDNRVSIPRSELTWRFSRSSGPGGQGVNTTDSRVELSFDLIGSQAIAPYLKERAIERLGSRLVDGRLTVSASEQRSQLQNRQSAEQKLTEVLAAAFAPPPAKRRKTRPSRSSVEKRISAKKRRGATKRSRRQTED